MNQQKSGLKLNLERHANLTAQTQPVVLPNSPPNDTLTSNVFSDSQGQYCSTQRISAGFNCWGFFVISINEEQNFSEHQPCKGMKERSQQGQAA